MGARPFQILPIMVFVIEKMLNKFKHLKKVTLKKFKPHSMLMVTC